MPRARLREQPRPEGGSAAAADYTQGGGLLIHICVQDQRRGEARLDGRSAVCADERTASMLPHVQCPGITTCVARPEGGSAGEWLAETKAEKRTKPGATPPTQHHPEGCSAARHEAWMDEGRGGDKWDTEGGAPQRKWRDRALT